MTNGGVHRDKRPRKSSVSSLDSVNEPQVSDLESAGEDTDLEENSDNGVQEGKETSDKDDGMGAGYDLDVDDSLSNPTITRFSKLKSKQPRRDTDTVSADLPASFASLGVSSVLQNALAQMSIRIPTEIQAACITPLLQGRDCIGNAKTGSGKTIAFALPILQKLALDPYGIYALVLTPTRELAFQISEQFAVLGAFLNLRTAVVVGGMDMMAQALELSNHPHVVVATPGRIVDLLKSNSRESNLSRIKFLVLDEADRLLTPTFAAELSYLFKLLPSGRQTCLFTATWSSAVDKLAEAPPRPGKMKPFVHRISAPVETVETLKQYYILVPSHVRESYLFDLLCNPPDTVARMRRAPPEATPPSKKVKRKKTQSGAKSSLEDPEAPEQPPPTIIFCNRPRTAAYLTSLLRTLSIRATALHSRLTQRERLNSLSLFRSYVIPVLVSTDVGARGLDIADVAMVINWDLPVESEEYTHRVGRTARAGRGGLAVSFVSERDEERMLKVEERINTKLAEIVLPESRVLEKLNAVSVAKRMANMELHDAKFGLREKIHKMKQTVLDA
ncbi:DEAD-domain-containing protein [Neolentinus lepideus HHB14362 ss-1]|uniref:DEAD-domain-containing protein n=1 Tax=Neolentinus lepideus HHB14362 ss-1 TaxID=1314782 RepID=A0A165V872_9AGAM|nr:DEAD-domain-containing protein [Neolentinus lepideus HHB14362 ss-1]